jgi:DNA-binding transcriptional LysR family regulator
MNKLDTSINKTICFPLIKQMQNTLHSVQWARKLKFRHLEVFLALHETGSITTAATRLHMTQPALSHWLADLESVVGQPLFLRNRRLELTGIGEVFRGHAERMLGEVYRTDAELKAVNLGMSGRVHIGSGLPRVLLPNTIVRLQNERPGIFISVVEAPFSALLDMLAEKSIDLIIGALGAQALSTGLACESLIPETIIIVAQRGHPSLQTRSLCWTDLLEYPWILPPLGSEMRATFDAAFAAQHVTPPMPCVEAGSSIRAQLLMGNSNYLSILLSSELSLYGAAGLQSVHLEPKISFPDIGAIWDAARCGPLVQYLLEELRIESHAHSQSQPAKTR